MVEYLYNFRTREWTFVEINGRFWGSLPLALAAGADFPKYLFQLLVDGKTDFSTRYRHNIACRNFPRDCRWLIDTVRANGLNPLKQLRLLGQLIAELRYPLTLRSYSDGWVIDDMRPGWREFREMVRDVRGRVGKKLFGGFERILPINNWRRKRFRAALKASKSMLFVCKGNICRSPFAEHYARKVLPRDFQIASCGYFPKSDRPSPQNAIAAAAELGVDLSGHRSQTVTNELISQANTVITFDEENKSTLLDTHRWAKKKTFPLGTISGQGSNVIDDPYGGSVSDFRSTYARIRDAIDECAASMGADKPAEETLRG